MGKRYEDRYGRGGYGRDRSDDRGYMERAGDEVRSWFGDDDAERRRYMDEQRDREREPRYGSDWDRSERSRPDWNRPDDRSDWQRSDSSAGDWERRQQWNERPAWGGSAASPSVGSRDRERTWSSADWDRERERAYRDNRSRQTYEPVRRPVSAWSVDDGRTEFSQQQRWGRGPKGYQRSDGRIHEDVCDRLTYSDVDAENIEVRVEGAVVTLSGWVRDRWDKRQAEDVAEQVAGVRDVHNNIRVQHGDRGIGQSDTSASDQPGTVLGINPTAGSTITHTPPKGTTRT